MIKCTTVRVSSFSNVLVYVPCMLHFLVSYVIIFLVEKIRTFASLLFLNKPVLTAGLTDGDRLKEWVEVEGEGDRAPRIRSARPISAMPVEGTRKRRRAAMGEYNWSIGDRVDAWMQDRYACIIFYIFLQCIGQQWYC